MKRICLIILVLIMAVSLCIVGGGCKKEPQVIPGNANNIETNPEEEFFLDIPSSLVGTTVKYATWSEPGDGEIAFENLTGIKYEQVTVPQGEYITKIMGLIAADQAPDIIIENSEFPRTLKIAQPLLVETTGIDVTDPFWDQEFVNMYTVGKYCYLINSAKSKSGTGACTYYNKLILEENGIKTPSEYVEEDNWNLDTLSVLMRQIRERAQLKPGSYINATVIMNMFGANETPWNTVTDTFSNGAKDPNMLSALKWLLKQQEEGLCGLMLEGSHVSLINGTAALQITGAFGLRSYPGWFYELNVDDLGFTYLPKVNKTDEKYPFTSSAGGYGICIGAKNPIGAGYYLRYSTNPDFRPDDDSYKNEEAKALYYELSENANFATANFSRGVRLTNFPDLISLEDGLMGSVIWSSTDQLSVKLDSVNNEIQASVDKANALVQEVIEAQE